jgi:heme exporter protein C
MTTDLAGARRTVRRGLWIMALGLAGLAATYVLAINYTPVERFQGLPQKIASILYLWLRDPRLDRFAETAAETGLVFSLVMLTTGPLWGKPVWNTWWTWDARLTFTLILFFVFLGYRALRGAVQDPGERARFAAVVGILGMVLVPFVHLTVYLFRTLHPQPIVLKPSAPSLPWEMLRTLLLSLGAYTVLLLGFFVTRYGLATQDELSGGPDAG